MSAMIAAPLHLPLSSSGRAILSRADLEAYDPGFRRSGGRERFYCPVHGGDHQRSLSVDPETGHYVCHSCKARGTLREFWAQQRWQPGRRHAPISLEAQGRALLAAKQRQDDDRCQRMAGELPAPAATFLERLGEMTQALREPDCPGAAYLRRRGLDPELAATLGAGYAAPNVWPGDRYLNNRRGVRNGRIVYPLADPLTGRVVSAVGRLCIDADTTWSEAQQEFFKTVKQRKLKGCPAGVWPYTAISTARECQRPLVIVEGPGDVLALQGGAEDRFTVLALVGTANVLPAAALRGVRVILALDDDEGGAKGNQAVRLDLAFAGVSAEIVPAGWLGDVGAKDPADLLDPRVIADRRTAVVAYSQAITAILTSARRGNGEVWDAERAAQLIAAMYERCGAAAEGVAAPPAWPEDLDQAINVACTERDWPALCQAVGACERVYLQALVVATEAEQRVQEEKWELF